MVNIYTSARYKFGKKKVKEEISQYLKERGFTRPYILNIVVVGKRKMKQIAKEYKSEEKIFPVLSFSYLEDEKGPSSEAQNLKTENLIGEIFICYPQAILLAAQREKKVDDIIINLIEHGVETIIRKSYQ